MSKAEQFISNKLKIRMENDSLRRLRGDTNLVDFCSNDYLGFARSPTLKLSIEETLSQLPGYRIGATGSRLITGNHTFTEDTEAFIADFHEAEAGLIFNSGYDANVGLLSSIGQRGDTIISDELIHASLIDGVRLTYAARVSFKHNDILDLEAKLKSAKGNVYVIVESVYSMDGDIAPLEEISMLCELYQADLIVDEAHAIGIFGEHGNGLVQHYGLEKKVFARVVTFGKSLGCHGAIVLGSDILRNYLINFARSFIYTTAAPLHTIASIRCGYKFLSEVNYTPLIQQKIRLYKSITSQFGSNQLPGKSSIQTVMLGRATAAKSAASELQSKGFDVRAILSPTVAEGTERLRICIHLFNTDEEIINLVGQLNKIKLTS